MRTCLFIALAAACLGLFGCKEKTETKPQPADSSSGNPLSAPADYVGAVVKAQKSAQKTISTVGLDQAIKTFAAEEGRFPNDLNELVTKGTIPSLPRVPNGMKFEYDPKTGIAKVVPQ